jgi:hypothetical protein
MERAELLAALATYPVRLGEASRAAADRAVPPGEWTPDLVVRHLIAVEVEVHQARLHDLAVATDEPRWGWAEPGPWSGEPELDLGALLSRFADLRAATLATVAALDAAGWARTGVHERLGRWDVAGLLANAVSHDEEHIQGQA